MIDETTTDELIQELSKRFEAAVFLLYRPLTGEIGGKSADYMTRFHGSILTNIGQTRAALDELLDALSEPF